MRSDAELNTIVRRLKFRKGIDSPANRAAASRELATLINIGTSILNRPHVAPGPQNKAVSDVANKCEQLRTSLEKHSRTLLERFGYFDEVRDNDQPDALDLLCQFDRHLAELQSKLKVRKLSAKRRRPVDNRRVDFIDECARYYRRWDRGNLGKSQNSRFGQFVADIFSHMKVPRAGNLSWQLERFKSEKGLV